MRDAKKCKTDLDLKGLTIQHVRKTCAVEKLGKQYEREKKVNKTCKALYD